MRPRRRRPFALVALGAALAVSGASACSLISTDGLTGGVDDGGPSDATADSSVPIDAPIDDAARDATPTPDAGEDADASDAMLDGGAEADAVADAGDPYTAAVLSDSPSAYWTLNDPVGATLAADQIGNAHIAQVQGTVTFGAPGVSGTAVDFGAGGLLTPGDYFDLRGTDPFTLEVWVKVDDYDAGFQNILFKRNGSPDVGYALYSRTGPQLQFQTDDNLTDGGGGPGGWTVLDGTAASTWAYVVATLDTSNHFHFYVNGIETRSEYDGQQNPGASGTTLNIGGNFGGTIDEVALYDHALSDVRIAAHYQLGKADLAAH